MQPLLTLQRRYSILRQREREVGGTVCVSLVQCLGGRLQGECVDFLASPGHGLQCKVTGVRLGVETGEEGGEGGEGRVIRYPCVVTEASLMNKPVTTDRELNVRHTHTHTHTSICQPNEYCYIGIDR